MKSYEKFHLVPCLRFTWFCSPFYSTQTAHMKLFSCIENWFSRFYILFLCGCFFRNDEMRSCTTEFKFNFWWNCTQIADNIQVPTDHLYTHLNLKQCCVLVFAQCAHCSTLILLSFCCRLDMHELNAFSTDVLIP